MFSEEHFLKLTGFPSTESSYSPDDMIFEVEDLAKIVNLLIESIDLVKSVELETGILRSLRLATRSYGGPHSSSYNQKIAADQLKAISYLEDNIVEALLSADPFVRVYAEVIYKRNRDISKKKTAEEHKQWFKKKK